ncbi:CPBP family intramembrane glutamic endopeptidase, partial [Myxosarcina sp. GI1]|uniref:CPBP family intramembrane glutamic endopeptidase n=1 Tax=Myxosarcina sp. GI1 TaxID=1541065 RepID=UPI00055F7F96
MSSLSRRQAAIALLLFVPVFSIGVTMSLLIAPGIVGNSVFTVAKVWAVVFPLWWTWNHNRHSLGLPRFDRQKTLIGLAWGLLMFGVIICAYLLLGKQWIELTDIRNKATVVGITSLSIYLAGCFYWCFINSFIEECIWRGFVYPQCEKLSSGIAAVALSAVFFTLHHIIALYAYTQNWLVVFIGSLGV